MKFAILFSVNQMYFVVKSLYRSYFDNQGPHVGQPCVAEWFIAQNLLTNVSKDACVTAHIQVRHLPIKFISNIARANLM